MSEESILCFGEIVWDALPEGIFLGGAPLNVAYHLNRLGRKAFPVSRLGDDFLGEETRRRLESRSVPLDLVETDPELPTGAVVVRLDDSGDARYTICEPAAWDRIGFSEALAGHADHAAALVYGSLAMREETNGKTLERLVASIPVRLCDVNLRAPFDDRDRVLHWARKATVIKLNEEELAQLSPVSPDEGFALSLEGLAELTGVGHLVLTRGGEGAMVWKDGVLHEAEVPEVRVADTVGAGDAFTAGYLNAFLGGSDAGECLRKAVGLGAFVAGKRGAQPEYEPDT
jgi:fructokinase